MDSRSIWTRRGPERLDSGAVGGYGKTRGYEVDSGIMGKGRGHVIIS